METGNRMNRDLGLVKIEGSRNAYYYLAAETAALRLNVENGFFSVRTLLQENAHLMGAHTTFRLMEIGMQGERAAVIENTQEARTLLWNGALYRYALRQDEQGALFDIEKLPFGKGISCTGLGIEDGKIKLYLDQAVEGLCLIAVHQEESIELAMLQDHAFTIEPSAFTKLHGLQYELFFKKAERLFPIQVEETLHCMIPFLQEQAASLVKIDMGKQATLAFTGIEEALHPEIYALIAHDGQIEVSGKWNAPLSLIQNCEKTMLFCAGDDSAIESVDMDGDESEFTLHITEKQLEEMQKRFSKRWDLYLELRRGDDVIAMLPIVKGKTLNAAILYEATWGSETLCSLQLSATKQKGNVYVQFLAPVHISKINYMEHLFGHLRIHMRMQQDVSAIYRGLSYQVKIGDAWQSARLQKRGARTLLLKVPCKDLEAMIAQLRQSGLEMMLGYREQRYCYTIKELDYSRIYATFSQHVFQSRRYRTLGKRLYRLFLKLPVRKNKILFESFLGRNVSGNPKYLYEYLCNHEIGKSYRMYWILNDPDETISAPGKKILRRSIRYYYHMATAGFWIFNTRQDSDIIKRKKTIYLQTWHGTPLKRLGFDMDDVNMASQSNIVEYKRQFYANSRRWDYLLAQNQYSADIFRRCFVFRKSLLALGYPANDVLFTKNNEQDIRSLKEKMGIPLDKKVILYAPTWRDDHFVRKGYYQMKMELDLKLMQERLGEEYVVLLRMHYLIMNVLDIHAYQGFAYDFSAGSDIQELYLVSDLLITDYSSVMFDYANLRRPIVFYTYDIDAYRDSLRGFYFDFEKEACGPICRTTSEVVEAIEKQAIWREEYAEKIASFHQKFNHIDDGNASKRILEIVLDRSRQEQHDDH